MVGFYTISAAEDGSMTHTLYVSLVSLYVSLVSSHMETVSKMCLFKIGQYHFTLLNSSHEEADEHLFGGLLFI